MNNERYLGCMGICLKAGVTRQIMNYELAVGKYIEQQGYCRYKLGNGGCGLVNAAYMEWRKTGNFQGNTITEELFQGKTGLAKEGIQVAECKEVNMETWPAR